MKIDEQNGSIGIVSFFWDDQITLAPLKCYAKNKYDDTSHKLDKEFIWNVNVFVVKWERSFETLIDFVKYLNTCV